MLASELKGFIPSQSNYGAEKTKQKLGVGLPSDAHNKASSYKSGALSKFTFINRCFCSLIRVFYLCVSVSGHVFLLMEIRSSCHLDWHHAAQIRACQGSGTVFEVKQEAKPSPLAGHESLGRSRASITTAVGRDEHACLCM